MFLVSNENISEKKKCFVVAGKRDRILDQFFFFFFFFAEADRILSAVKFIQFTVSWT